MYIQHLCGSRASSLGPFDLNHNHTDPAGLEITADRLFRYRCNIKPLSARFVDQTKRFIFSSEAMAPGAINISKRKWAERRGQTGRTKEDFFLVSIKATVKAPGVTDRYASSRAFSKWAALITAQKSSLQRRLQ